MGVKRIEQSFEATPFKVVNCKHMAPSSQNASNR